MKIFSLKYSTLSFNEKIDYFPPKSTILNEKKSSKKFTPLLSRKKKSSLVWKPQRKRSINRLPVGEMPFKEEHKLQYKKLSSIVRAFQRLTSCEYGVSRASSCSALFTGPTRSEGPVGLNEYATVWPEEDFCRQNWHLVKNINSALN